MKFDVHTLLDIEIDDGEHLRHFLRAVNTFPKALVEIGRTLEEGDATRPKGDWREKEIYKHASRAHQHFERWMWDEVDERLHLADEDDLAHGTTRGMMALETREDGE